MCLLKMLNMYYDSPTESAPNFKGQSCFECSSRTWKGLSFSEGNECELWDSLAAQLLAFVFSRSRSAELFLQVQYRCCIDGEFFSLQFHLGFIQYAILVALSYLNILWEELEALNWLPSSVCWEGDVILFHRQQLWEDIEVTSSLGLLRSGLLWFWAQHVTFPANCFP